MYCVCIFVRDTYGQSERDIRRERGRERGSQGEMESGREGVRER